jgi:hypothetical protein
LFAEKKTKENRIDTPLGLIRSLRLRIKSGRTVEAVLGSSQVANVLAFLDTVVMAVCQVKERAMEHARDSASKV